jgi:hypothetical protein
MRLGAQLLGQKGIGMEIWLTTCFASGALVHWTIVLAVFVV